MKAWTILSLFSLAAGMPTIVLRSPEERCFDVEASDETFVRVHYKIGGAFRVLGILGIVVVVIVVAFHWFSLTHLPLYVCRLLDLCVRACDIKHRGNVRPDASALFRHHRDDWRDTLSSRHGYQITPGTGTTSFASHRVRVGR